MRCIGLLGGMSWESTLGYYRALNEGVKAALGGLHSAPIVLYSVDFAPLERLQRDEDWEAIAEHLCQAALRVQAAGADFLLIGTNTMHRVAPQIEAVLDIPLVHIADATAEVLKQQGVRSLGLLGTAFTMEQDFYRGRLQSRHGLEVLTPGAEDRALVHDIIYQELCQGHISVKSRSQYLRIIQALADRGAEAVVLGCTEIGLLVKQEDTAVPLLDTTAIHARKAVAMALETGPGS